MGKQLGNSRKSSLVGASTFFLKGLFEKGLSRPPPGRITSLYEDSRTCVAWSEGSVGGSDRAKHIDLRGHFVHDAVERGSLKLKPIASSSNVADLLTKPLGTAVFQGLRKALMGY